MQPKTGRSTKRAPSREQRRAPQNMKPTPSRSYPGDRDPAAAGPLVSRMETSGTISTSKPPKDHSNGSSGALRDAVAARAAMGERAFRRAREGREVAADRSSRHAETWRGRSPATS